MKIIFKLAWRNIWRNRRRSLITLTSMAFGLAALVFQQSLIKSLQDQIVEKATRTYSSHIQVQSKLTTDPKVPDARISDPKNIFLAFDKIPQVKIYSPRTVFTGLVSSALTSKGSLVLGIDPEREQQLTIVHTYLVEGENLKSGSDHQVVLGVKLAKELDIRLGEKMVIMVQGSDGSLSAEAFRVVGLFKTGSPVYDGQIVYIPIVAAQRMLVCGEGVSMVSAHVKNPDDIQLVQKKLSELLKDEPIDVLTWKESAHEIVGIQEFQDAILLIVMIVVFSIVALGIFNTLLMSLFERIREFGLMLALGAKPRFVASLILIEAFILGGCGVLIGNVVGLLLVAYFHVKGIPLPIGDAMGYWMPFDRVIYLRFVWAELAFSSIAALLTSFLAALIPAYRAAQIQPVEALRHY